MNETDIQIGEREYRIVKNHRDAFDPERLGERFSEVLARYDYIVGDWGYEQLRLRGFFDTSNRRAAPDQRIDTLEDYLYEYCNFGCAYFVIERTGERKEKQRIVVVAIKRIIVLTRLSRKRVRPLIKIASQ